MPRYSSYIYSRMAYWRGRKEAISKSGNRAMQPLHPSPECFMLTNTTNCGSTDVFLLGGMKADDEWTDIEHAVDRHDAAIIEEATTIAQLRCQIALIIEAFEKLDLCTLQGLENHSQGEAARDRYREILQQLKASYAAKT